MQQILVKKRWHFWPALATVLAVAFGTLAALKIAPVQSAQASTVFNEPTRISTGSNWTTAGGRAVKETLSVGMMKKHVDSANGPIAFCTELGTFLGGPGTTPSGFTAVASNTALQQEISAIAYYGYQTQPTDKNYVATQWMIWEALGDKLQADVGGILSMADYNAFKASVNQKIQAITTQRSFNGTTVNLKPGQSVTLNDTTGGFNYYNADATSNTAGVTAQHNGNALTLTASASSNAKGAVVYQANIAPAYRGTPLVYESATLQDVIRPLLDPIHNPATINVNVDKTTHIVLQKLDVSTDPGKKDALAGVTYHFTKDGKDFGDYTTDAQGQIHIDKDIADLTGDWTYQETKTVNGFKLDSTVKKFSIAATDAGKTINLTAENSRVPENLHTTALSDDQSHIQEPKKQVTITDKVQYENAVVGKKYTVTGVLMDKSTRQALLDDNGKEVRKEITFTATQANGFVEVPFTFDAALLAGKTTVAFETMSRDGIQVAVHNDINDVPQTVTFSHPKIQTTATDTDGSHDVLPEDKLTIKDEVAYSDLVVGKTYNIKGTLMDAKTGKAVLDANGNEITAEKTFTATQADGTVEMDYTIDASQAQGKSFVVFEDLYRDGKTIYVHEDLNDKDQTVTVVQPTIHTTATSNGAKTATAAHNMTIDDVVATHDLVVGKTYTIQGVLMDKSTGKPLMVNGKQVTAEKTFVATSKDQNVTITFSFDGSQLAGKDVVAFEKLYHNGNLIMSHEDLNDAGQTVHIAPAPAPKTPIQKLTQTDDHMNGMMIVLGLIALVGAAVAGFFLLKKRA